MTHHLSSLMRVSTRPTYSTWTVVGTDMNSRSIMFSKLPSTLARTNSRQFVARSPGSTRCNQFYFKQDVFCVLSCQTILEMWELSYNLYRCELQCIWLQCIQLNCRWTRYRKSYQNKPVCLVFSESLWLQFLKTFNVEWIWPINYKNHLINKTIVLKETANRIFAYI